MAAESDIEKKAVAYARSLGFMCFKFTSPNVRGVLDRVFISPAGAVLFLEFKAPGKKPTVLQLHMIEKLRKQNVAAWWVDNLFRAHAMLRSFNDGPTKFNQTYK